MLSINDISLIELRLDLESQSGVNILVQLVQVHSLKQILALFNEITTLIFSKFGLLNISYTHKFQS